MPAPAFFLGSDSCLRYVRQLGYLRVTCARIVLLQPHLDLSARLPSVFVQFLFVVWIPCLAGICLLCSALLESELQRGEQGAVAETNTEQILSYYLCWRKWEIPVFGAVLGGGLRFVERT